jgi:hypothetical protein
VGTTREVKVRIQKSAFIVFLVLGLAACSDQSPTRVEDPGSDGAVVQGVSLTVYIDQEGGVLTGDYSELDVPEGAVEQETLFSMDELTEENGDPIEFGPSGLTFDTPCTLWIDKPQLSGSHEYHIFWYDEDGEEWIDIGGTDAGTAVYTSIEHFSRYKISEIH